MIQVQFVLDFRDGNNHIDLNILEREDANDLERELARHIQELHASILEEMKEQMPGDVEVTFISGPA
jgi:hypothetical protein